MSDRSRYSPERRALFLTLGALGAGLRPVLAAADPVATGQAKAGRDDEGGVRPPRPPIIIKGGSFYVELDKKETGTFQPVGSVPNAAFLLPPSAGMLVVDLDVKILGFSDENIELKETKRSISQLDLTVTSTTDGTVYDKVTLKVAGKDGLSVTTTVKSGNGCLKTANDGPPQRPHRLKHRGFGPDVGSWISELDLTQGTTQLPPYNDPNLEYRLKIQLNEKSATSPSPRAG